MARTYRRKTLEADTWLLTKGADDLDSIDFNEVETIETLSYRWIPGRLYYSYKVKKDSVHGKKRIAYWHSEAYRSFKEPGPSWFRNMTTERPQRREAKRQLQRYMLDSDYCVILNAKDHLEYWT